MKILAIESSCDETAAAVVENGTILHSSVVVSQIDIHAEYGGVIPEIAARSHIEAVLPVVDKALADAKCTWNDIDAIAVTYAPGLVGSLLIGTLTARTLALLHNKPLYPIHHVEAHVYANFITKLESGYVEDSASGALQSQRGGGFCASRNEDCLSEASSAVSEAQNPTPTLRNAIASEEVSSKKIRLEPEFPLLALIVSGGHTQLVLFKGHGDYELLGQTQDDAVGEAFDKVAKILGLPYPGGPSISKAALDGDPKKYDFPISKLQNPYDFSFSGLKTAVLRRVQAEAGKDFTFPSHELAELLTSSQRNDFAASFQHIAVTTLVKTARRAFDAYQPRSVVNAGGVAANQLLREYLQEAIPRDIQYAPMALCTDNAAMIGALAYFVSQHVAPCDPYSLEVIPSVSMRETAWCS